MLTLVWRESAREQVKEIVSYIAERNPAAADRLQTAVEACAEQLPEHPFLHRPGRVAGTREAVVHPNYLLIYRVMAETIEILNVLHTRRRYP